MGRTGADPLIGAAAGSGSGRRDAAQIGQSGAYERCRELVGMLDRCSSALRTRSGRGHRRRDAVVRGCRAPSRRGRLGVPTRTTRDRATPPRPCNAVLHLVFDQLGLHRAVARSTPATTARSASRGWPPEQHGQSFMSSDELALFVRSSN